MGKPTLTILSKQEAKVYKPKKFFKQKPIMIRILDGSPYKEEKPVKYYKHYKHQLNMEFLDIEIEDDESMASIERRQNIYGDLLFNESHVQSLNDFLKTINIDETSEIVIHCTAGERRSVAIGLIISKYFTQDVDTFNAIQNNKRFPFGNAFVYEKCDEWFSSNEYRHQ